MLVRLDTSARTPGLSLVHEAVSRPTWQHFGPYLGGSRLRIALRALHRVLPLSLTESTPMGSARDLARIRSVGPAHREEFTDRIIAVLQRKPTAIGAVGDELIQLRSAAADRLDFERAATVQAEREAFLWLVAPQRVMVPDAGDGTFSGWSDGFAVDFRMTAGAVDAWRIRRASQAASADRVAATPTPWREYAARAARLAARLSDDPA